MSKNSNLLYVLIPSSVGVSTGSPELMAPLAAAAVNGGEQGLLLVANTVLNGGAAGFPVTVLGLADNADNVAPIDGGTSNRYEGVVSRPTVYDAAGDNWDRARAVVDNADALAALGLGLQGMVSRPQGWDPVESEYNRMTMSRTDDDEFIPGTVIADALRTLSLTALAQGTAFSRARAISSLSVDPDAVIGVQQVAQTTEWTESAGPAAATQATCTRTNPGGGARLVCRSITARIATDAAAQTPLRVFLRDGATGAGTIIWQTVVACPVNSANGVEIPGLNIVGSTDTDMTLEFSAAGVAGSLESVALSGFTAP